MRPNWIAIGGFSAALAMLLGAAGAHMIRGHVSPGDFDVWKTGVLYQMLHALGLVLFGLFQDGWRRDGRAASDWTGWAFLLGTVLFSGPLYAHPLGAHEAVLHFAPIGGLLLIVGWIAFAVSALRSPARA